MYFIMTIKYDTLTRDELAQITDELTDRHFWLSKNYGVAIIDGDKSLVTESNPLGIRGNDGLVAKAAFERVYCNTYHFAKDSEVLLLGANNDESHTDACLDMLKYFATEGKFSWFDAAQISFLMTSNHIERTIELMTRMDREERSRQTQP